MEKEKSISTELLTSILEGRPSATENIKELRLFLLAGGTAPEAMFIPEKCAPWLKRFRKDRKVTADYSRGLLIFDTVGRVRVLMRWSTVYDHLHSTRLNPKHNGEKKIQ